jgi:hypothetical protein
MPFGSTQPRQAFAFRGFVFLEVQTMRTYDKLIATIPDRRSLSAARPLRKRSYRSAQHEGCLFNFVQPGSGPRFHIPS